VLKYAVSILLRVHDLLSILHRQRTVNAFAVFGIATRPKRIKMMNKYVFLRSSDVIRVLEKF
jgi:hypothetical protein